MFASCFGTILASALSVAYATRCLFVRWLGDRRQTTGVQVHKRHLNCEFLQDLAHTVRTRLNGRPRFDAPKHPAHNFSVDHYAGKVTYSSLLLMDKNKDFVIAEHAALMKASGFAFAR